MIFQSSPVPFTPIHFGPPLFVASVIYLLRGRQLDQTSLLWIGGLIIGSVIPDLQGVYSVFVDPTVPLHGFSHTLVGALAYAALGVLFLVPVFYLLSIHSWSKIQGYLVILLGIILFHFLPDMLIWSDMNITWPFFQFSPGQESNYGRVALVLARLGFLGLIIGIVGLSYHGFPELDT